MNCPNCGAPAEVDGTVFIEDGPWTGSDYANEGDYTRYHCPSCDHWFADAPEPMQCACGNRICGEPGEDCQCDDGTNAWICEECMKKEVAE